MEAKERKGTERQGELFPAEFYTYLVRQVDKTQAAIDTTYGTEKEVLKVVKKTLVEVLEQYITMTDDQETELWGKWTEKGED